MGRNHVGRPTIDVPFEVMIDAFVKHGNFRSAAEELGMHWTTLQKKLKGKVQFEKKVVKVKVVNVVNI